MSYILDALKKADHERSIGDLPDLDTPHWSQRRAGPVRYWVWLVAGLLIFNGMLLAVLLNRDRVGDGGQASSVPAQQQEMQQERFDGAAQDVPQPRQQTAVMQPQGLPLTPLARPQERVIAAPRQVLPAMPPAVAQAGAATSTATAAADSTGAAVVARRPPARQAAAAADEGSAADVPEWSELSLQFRSGFNPPRLDVHVYDEDPSRRFILVELKRYGEGDTLNNGAKLEKILPDSIQLLYQGTRFRLER